MMRSPKASTTIEKPARPRSLRSRRKILIMLSDDEIVEGLLLLLSMEGHEVVIYSDEKEWDDRLDLIIFDYSLQRISEWRALNGRSDKSFPSLCLLLHPLELEMRETLKSESEIAFLDLPFSKKELFRAMTEIMRDQVDSIPAKKGALASPVSLVGPS